MRLPGAYFSSTDYGRPEELDRALAEENDWMRRTGIKPLGVETLTKVTGGSSTTFSSSDIGLRVWYVIGTDNCVDR